jgi:hypothetical protein
MKCKEVIDPMTKAKRVIFWCAGCGQFHDVPAESWNGDADSPTIEPASGPVYFTFNPGERQCDCYVHQGKVYFSHGSAHRMAGQESFRQHEESWREGSSWDAKVEKKP